MNLRRFSGKIVKVPGGLAGTSGCCCARECCLTAAWIQDPESEDPNVGHVLVAWSCFSDLEGQVFLYRKCEPCCVDCYGGTGWELVDGPYNLPSELSTEDTGCNWSNKVACYKLERFMDDVLVQTCYVCLNREGACVGCQDCPEDKQACATQLFCADSTEVDGPSDPGDPEFPCNKIVAADTSPRDTTGCPITMSATAVGAGGAATVTVSFTVDCECNDADGFWVATCSRGGTPITGTGRSGIVEFDYSYSGTGISTQNGGASTGDDGCVSVTVQWSSAEGLYPICVEGQCGPCTKQVVSDSCVPIIYRSCVGALD